MSLSSIIFIMESLNWSHKERWDNKEHVITPRPLCDYSPVRQACTLGGCVCAFQPPCRLGEMGCRVLRGAEWERILSRANCQDQPSRAMSPKACPARRSSLWLAFREKPRERAAAALFALLSISQRSLVQVDLIKWTGTVHCWRRFAALIK